jgi:hypothetical protein
MKRQLEETLEEYQQDWTVTQWMKVGYWWTDKFAELRGRLAPRVSQEEEEMLIRRGEGVELKGQQPADECCVM